MTSISRGRVELRIGSRVWWQAATWTIASVGDGCFHLTTGDRTATVSINELAQAVVAEAPTAARDDNDLTSALALSNLSVKDRTELEQLGDHIAALLADPSPLGPRVEAAARELGVSTRSFERKVAAYRRAGVAGLVDARRTLTSEPRIDPRWDDACQRVLRQYTNASTPTRSAVIARVSLELEREHGEGVVPVPSQATAYRRLEMHAKGKYTFGTAKGRRQVADRPEGSLGRLRADRPGQYVVLDTNSLDVFAMEPVTMRWLPVQLTMAMDLYTRCIVGLRLTPVSTKSIDIANVLYQAVTPDSDPATSQPLPYHGVPRGVLLGTEEISQRLADANHLPVVFPETIIVDRGRQYLSAHIVSAAARLGISVQPANPYKPTDKPWIERFFGTLRTGLLQHLPAYKGPDVYNRGKDVEDQAFYYIGELEQIIREWVATVYHHTPHDGLTLPETPRLPLTPLQAYQIGIARAGGLHLPANDGLAHEFLEVRWRQIHHYGVEVDGLRYDSPALNPYRGVRSPYTGRHAGKWPLHLDAHDVRHLHFHDPADGAWHRLAWEHAPSLDAPFSKEAVEYAKRLAQSTGTLTDPAAAVRNLLVRWEQGQVVERRERNLARRLSAQRDHALTEHERQAPAASEPEHPAGALRDVIDFAEQRRARRTTMPPDDLDEFERYEPGDDGFGVLD